MYHADGLGSVRALTDSSGSVVQTSGTDAFGIPDATLTSGSSPQPFGYTGEQQLAGGLVDLRAQLYDPGSGRFLQADPLRKSGPGIGGWNRYAYVGNNPATLKDPSGLKAMAMRMGAEEAPQGQSRYSEQNLNLWPDYVQFGVGVSPIYGVAGPAFSVTRDRYGEWYFGTGLQVGRGPIAGVSVTAGYVWQGEIPSPDQLLGFNSGLGVNLGGGSFAGGSLQVSPFSEPTKVGPQLGFYTPQVGASVQYSWSASEIRRWIESIGR